VYRSKAAIVSLYTQIKFSEICPIRVLVSIYFGHRFVYFRPVQLFLNNLKLQQTVSSKSWALGHILHATGRRSFQPVNFSLMSHATILVFQFRRTCRRIPLFDVKTLAHVR